MNESPSAILRKWFERVWNAGDESVLDELYGASAVAHGQPATPIPGPEGFKPLYRSFRSAFPNIRIEVTHAVSEGDLGVVHCRVTGTHTGDGLGVPPTNRSVDFIGMTMARVADGRIHEGWNAYDFLSMYQQLGIEPPKPV
jgi:predicted ester cyclase